MLILFPQSSLDSDLPDEAFAREWGAAQAADLRTGLVDIDLPDHPRLNRDMRKTHPGELLIYRGWMLTVAQYAKLYEMVWELGYRMINTPAEYRYCHELPQWYDDFGGATPKSVWFENGEEIDGGLTTAVREKLGDGPYIIKDYVKSKKHEWETKCYIPTHEDIERVTTAFMEDDEPQGGLVFRKFVPLKRVGTHPKSGIPLSNELRTWKLRGGPLVSHTYWGPGEGGDDIVMPQGVLTIMDLEGEGTTKPPITDWRIKSNFFTMDFAMHENGGWVVIELGDGQVAGLPEHVDAEAFYRELKQRFV